MSVRVNVKKDLKGIPVKTRKMTRLGQYALVNQAHADMNNYVPFLDGNLRNQSTISLDSKSIIWNVPYARRQYFNYGAKFTTPGTGPKWDSKALVIHRDSWIRVLEKAMK